MFPKANSNIQGKNSRIAYLDILRIIAIFGVITQHVCAPGYLLLLGTHNWYIYSIGEGQKWAVPLFVMISGAIFLNPKKNISIKNILKKYIPRLLFAYLFWLVVYALIAPTWSVPYYHLWFLPMLIGVYLLIPITRKIASDERVLQYAVVVWHLFISANFSLFGMTLFR